jgi:hypothetical protein
MMNSYTCTHFKKDKTYLTLGGVVLIALLSSSSLLHAIKSPEELEEANHVPCLKHLDEKTNRQGALETLENLEKNALTGGWQAHLKYLKKVAEFLKEDPSYRPVTMGSPTGLSQSDESPTTFFEILHSQALSNLFASPLSHLEKSFERTRLNFFYDRVKKRLSGEIEEPVHWEIGHSLHSIRLTICGEGYSPVHSRGIATIQSTAEIYAGLNLRVRFFQEYYLSKKPDKRILKDIAASAKSMSGAESQEERASLQRFAARIHSKLSE